MKSVFEIVKSDIKGYLRGRLMGVSPEDLSKLNERVIQKSLAYAQGYADSLEKHISKPYNIEEVQSFVFEETFEYTYLLIKE